ncbi:MAG TPA: four helix bundle protein [Cyclobacteriaceae bacterium]|nr:four helix bundle protein [Cyclobacteriaceae bacterium]
MEERTFQFARSVRIYVRKLPKDSANIQDGKQVIRASASIGANYIEANEALSKKDFIYRIKVSRKEAKESAFFLRLIFEGNSKEYEKEGRHLYDEALQLRKILSTILGKSQ